MADLSIAWGPVRSVLEGLTFASIKDVVGLGGVDLRKLSHLDQKFSGGATKGQLMTAIDGVIREFDGATFERFLRIVTEEVLRGSPGTMIRLQDQLARLGWAYSGGALLPIDLLDPAEVEELPEESRQDLTKAASRLRDGDLSGAVSAACGAVDSVTARVYAERGLGDPGAASFQEKVNRAIRASGVVPSLEAQLAELGWHPADIRAFKENLIGSINQAAFVMQKLRSEMGDVHGTKPILRPLVFDSVKWAALIMRLLRDR